MGCYCLKFEKWFIFYMALEAIEQMNLGVYDTEIRCNFKDGSMIVDTFALMDEESEGMWSFGVSHALIWLSLSYKKPIFYTLYCVSTNMQYDSYLLIVVVCLKTFKMSVCFIKT